MVWIQLDTNNAPAFIQKKHTLHLQIMVSIITLHIAHKKSCVSTLFCFALCGTNLQVVISFPSLPLRVFWSTRCGRVRDLSKKNPLQGCRSLVDERLSLQVFLNVLCGGSYVVVSEEKWVSHAPWTVAANVRMICIPRDFQWQVYCWCLFKIMLDQKPTHIDILQLKTQLNDFLTDPLRFFLTILMFDAPFPLLRWCFIDPRQLRPPSLRLLFLWFSEARVEDARYPQ